MGLEPSPRCGNWRRPPKVGCVCVEVGGERSSGCAGRRLPCLCVDHVQEGRLGAPGAQPRWVTAPGPGAPSTRRVCVCVCVWVCARFWAGGGPRAALLPLECMRAASAQRPNDLCLHPGKRARSRAGYVCV